MTADLLSERLAHIARVPPALLDYVQWLKEQRRPATGRDYLFAEDKPRFEPRKDDVVAALPGLRLQERGRSLRLQGMDGSIDLELAGLSRRDAQRILECIDGRRCLAEVLWDSGVEQDKLARFLRSTFGAVVFAPAAVTELERALPAVQIVRFPCAPYAVERAYWQNMRDVRVRLIERKDALASATGLLELLRELHVLALMGRSLDSFYMPASPSAEQRVAPGVLFDDEPRVIERASCNVFLDGPRVNVSFVGGEGYHRTLYQGLEDEGAGDAQRDHVVQGVSWGRVLLARSERDDRARPWFCPPRPMREEHFEELRAQLDQASNAASRADRAALVRACARFHQAFVRLHPFHCANQSVAMNIVNALLTQGLGAGIPHLVLDLIALRLEPGAYERAFERAVSGWTVLEDDPARRFAVLRERKLRSQALVERVSAAANHDDRQALIEADPDAARWALLIS